MNETHARQVVRNRAGHLCERCGYVFGAEWHHRRNRSQSGTWSPANGLWLCSPCHRRVSEYPFEARTYGWAVPSTGTPATTPVLMARYGWVWLDDHGIREPLDQVDITELGLPDVYGGVA